MELPQLKSLLLFAIVARCGSFKLAAQELSRTPGAVSHGIKSLEKWLNVELFDRRKPELVLTPAGHDYLPYINDALSKIAQGTDEILHNNGNSHDTPALNEPRDDLGIRFHSTHHLRHGFLPAGRRTSSSMTRVSCIRSTIKTKAPGGAF